MDKHDRAAQAVALYCKRLRDNGFRLDDIVSLAEDLRRAETKSRTPCSVSGCHLGAVSRGMCQRHYQRAWKMKRQEVAG